MTGFTSGTSCKGSTVLVPISCALPSSFTTLDTFNSTAARDSCVIMFAASSEVGMNLSATTRETEMLRSRMGGRSAVGGVIVTSGTGIGESGWKRIQARSMSAYVEAVGYTFSSPLSIASYSAHISSSQYTRLSTWRVVAISKYELRKLLYKRASRTGSPGRRLSRNLSKTDWARATS
jgi:hypothetical protein